MSLVSLQDAPGQPMVSALLDAVKQFPSLADLKSTKITDANANDMAKLLGAIVDTKRVADTARFDITRPYDAEKAQIMAWFVDHLESPLQDSEQLLREKLGKHFDRIDKQLATATARASQDTEKQRHKLQARAVAARGRGQIEKAQQLEEEAEYMVPALPAKPRRLPGVRQRKVWKWEVIDASALDDRFLQPNAELIEAQVKRLGEDAARLVGGIRVFKKSAVTVTD